MAKQILQRQPNTFLSIFVCNSYTTYTGVSKHWCVNIFFFTILAKGRQVYTFKFKTIRFILCLLEGKQRNIVIDIIHWPSKLVEGLLQCYKNTAITTFFCNGALLCLHVSAIVYTLDFCLLSFSFDLFLLFLLDFHVNANIKQTKPSFTGSFQICCGLAW